MDIGDKVRLLHGNEEGIITKISSGGRVEIEIEDGFRIPAMKNEVVIIHASEKQYFGKEEKAIAESPYHPKAPVDKEEGIFLSYIPLNDKDHSVYLVNNTKKDHVFAVSELFGENSRTLSAGVLAAGTFKKIEEKSTADFEKWPVLYFQMIPIQNKIDKKPRSFEKKIQFKAGSFFKSKGKTPVLDKNGYLFRIDQNTKELDVNLLNRELNAEKETQITIERPSKEIDLHIEQLTADHDLMSNSEILRLQMDVFDKKLHAAIATGMDEIIFIHGIGNGVLKKEIQKFLSQLTNIKYFQDAQKTKFGYGATLVRIN